MMETYTSKYTVVVAFVHCGEKGGEICLVGSLSLGVVELGGTPSGTVSLVGWDSLITWEVDVILMNTQPSQV